MPLTDAELKEIEAIIEKRRQVLLAEIKRGLTRSRIENFDTIAGEAPDAGDEALASLVADTKVAEASRDLRELRELEAALARIKDGTYGTCIDCGAEIPFERLRANPGAVRDVNCQTIYERTHRRPGEPSL